VTGVGVLVAPIPINDLDGLAFIPAPRSAGRRPRRLAGTRRKSSWTSSTPSERGATAVWHF